MKLIPGLNSVFTHPGSKTSFGPFRTILYFYFFFRFVTDFPSFVSSSKLSSGSGTGRSSRPGRTSDPPWFLSGSDTLGRLAGNTLG